MKTVLHIVVVGLNSCPFLFFSAFFSARVDMQRLHLVNLIDIHLWKIFAHYSRIERCSLTFTSPFIQFHTSLNAAGHTATPDRSLYLLRSYYPNGRSCHSPEARGIRLVQCSNVRSQLNTSATVSSHLDQDWLQRSDRFQIGHRGVISWQVWPRRVIDELKEISRLSLMWKLLERLD